LCELTGSVLEIPVAMKSIVLVYGKKNYKNLRKRENESKNL
jgi:hypothetical protein